MVEAAGIEPASEGTYPKASTRLSALRMSGARGRAAGREPLESGAVSPHPTEHRVNGYPAFFFSPPALARKGERSDPH